VAFLPNVAKVSAGVARGRGGTPSFLPPGLAKRLTPQAPSEAPSLPRGFSVGIQPQTSPFVRPTQPPMMFAPSPRARAAPQAYDINTGRIQSSFANTLPATPSRPPNVPATYGLGDDGEDDFAQFGGFSLKGLVGAVKGAVVGVGHAVGSAVTSKVGQVVIGTGLALTGVGAPAAAGIFAATKGVGTLIKPGGNIKGALTGAAQGAIEGVVAANALNIAKGAVNVAKSAGGAVVSGAEKVLHIGGAPAAPTAQATDIGSLVNPAAMSAAIQAATGHAEDANAGLSQVAQQGNGIQAQIAQATSTGNDQAVAQLQQAYLEQQQQLAAAQQAAAAAQAAAQALQQGGGSLTGQQVAGYVGAAAQGSAAAQIAAAAPFTPDGTAAAQQAADQAAAASMDATTGQPSGGLLSHPLILAAVVGGGLLLIAGSKKRRRRAQAA
jgi:hypothetical protein